MHRKLSARFPFAIYYRVADPVIDVVAILDCRRDPDTIARRLGDSIMRTVASDATADQLLDYLASDGTGGKWTYFAGLSDW